MADGFATAGGVNYKVTPEYLQQAVTDTNSTANDVANELSQLQTFIVSLEDVWGGMAHDQFQTLMADFNLYGKMLHDALTDIASGLQGNYVNYVDSEMANLKSLSALGEEVPGMSLRNAAPRINVN